MSFHNEPDDDTEPSAEDEAKAERKRKKEARGKRKAELGESVKGALPVAKDRDSRLSVEHDQQIARPAYRATKSLDVTDRAAGKTEVENRESSEPRTFQSFPKPSRKGAK